MSIFPFLMYCCLSSSVQTVPWLCEEKFVLQFKQRMQSKDPAVRVGAIEEVGNRKDIAQVVIPELINALGDKKAEVVGAASIVLHQMGPMAFEVLAEAVNSKNKKIRFYAMGILSYANQEKRPPTAIFLKATEHPDEDVRCQAVDGLALQRDVTSISRLIHLSQKDPSWHVRWHAVGAFANFEKEASLAVPIIIQYLEESLSEKDDIKRMIMSSVAEGSLVCIGFPSVKPLVTVVGDKKRSDDLRGIAISSLSAIANEELGTEFVQSIPLLIPCLEDPYDHVRRETARLFGKMGPKARAAIPGLHKLVKKGKSHEKAIAAESLFLIDGNKDAFMRTALEVIRAKDPRARIVTATALGRFGFQEGLPSLIEACRDQDGEVRHAAVSAINCIRPLSAAALNAVHERLEDENESVASVARMMLEDYYKNRE